MVTYRVRPPGADNPVTALERRILDCIDMSRVDDLGSDAIDYARLDQVQAGL